MTGHQVDIRLLGFAGFKASKRFLRSLEDEIWVERWDRKPQLEVVRPTEVQNAGNMKDELEARCRVAVISAHGGRGDRQRMYFAGEYANQDLYVDMIGRLGATSAVLIDACYAGEFFVQLRSHARRGVILVGVDSQDEIAWGRDSVTVTADVIRELCYTNEARLDSSAVERAFERVNAQITARNKLVHGRGTARPLAIKLKC
jgi:hypothetical protein